MQELISREAATGVEIWRAAEGNAAAEVQAARGGVAAWAAKPLTVRIETLRRFANILRIRLDDFIDLIARESGLPLWEARAEAEAVIAQVDVSVSAYADRTPQRRLEGDMGARSAVRHRPLGVVAVITPYAMPASLPGGQIVPALIAGNTVVFKPSERAVATGAFLVSAGHEAGIPENALRLLPGGPETGEALARERDVDALFFTGSARSGLKLKGLLADRHDLLVSMSLGGNNPILLWNTSEVHSAAALIVQSAFGAGGQRCTAGRRLIVEDGRFEPFLAEIRNILKRMIIGAPLDSPAPFMGPMIDEAQAEAVEQGYQRLIEAGGKPVIPLERPFPGKPFLTPAIIDVTNIAAPFEDEIFGPVLQLVRVPDFDAALREANRGRFGLAATLIGSDPADYERFWAEVRAGLIGWNRTILRPHAAAPFGGLGLSGNHRPGGFYTADHCVFPVASLEAEHARAFIGIGLSDI